LGLWGEKGKKKNVSAGRIMRDGGNPGGANGGEKDGGGKAPLMDFATGGKQW